MPDDSRRVWVYVLVESEDSEFWLSVDRVEVR